jgi:hypothetical protein
MIIFEEKLCFFQHYFIFTYLTIYSNVKGVVWDDHIKKIKNQDSCYFPSK